MAYVNPDEHSELTIKARTHQNYAMPLFAPQLLAWKARLVMQLSYLPTRWPLLHSPWMSAYLGFRKKTKSCQVGSSSFPVAVSDYHLGAWAFSSFS
jgi:hypothetical protein